MAWSDWSKRSAYLLVQTDWGAGEKLWKESQAWKETIGSWLTTGPWDLVVWLDAKSWEDVYEKASWIRAQKGVRATSSHFVYKGTKNGKWWWEWPVGNWVFARTPRLNGEIKEMQKLPWAASAASIPGDWDYMVWVGGQKWEEVWDHVGELNKDGWHTQTLIPMKSWWNQAWKNSWWAKTQEGTAAAA
ncbi:MAG TPA: hypothetical protein VNK24_01070 [Elusimicrobiota bacterium]|nr:hypothetical protein [Elusimicrobiota bacterium]